MLLNQLISPGTTDTDMHRRFIPSPIENIPCLEATDVAEVVISVLAMPEGIQVQ
jgi:hypothetical protein